jgi:thiol-disulfide isomerase/thioredoxin
MNMRNLVLLLLFAPLFTKGQDAVIHFNAQRAPCKTIGIVTDDYTTPDRLFERDEDIVIPLKGGKATWRQTLTTPGFVKTYYRDSIVDKYYSYVFYVSPGDNLSVTFDTRKLGATYTVKGKGSENNQPSIQALYRELDLSAYQTDSLPNRVWKEIQGKNAVNQRILTDYISKYRPGKDFEKIYALYLRYFPVWNYVDFKGNQGFYVQESYPRNAHRWEAIEDSLTRVVSVNNDEMLRVDGHNYFLAMYLIRLKERVWSYGELLQGYYGTHTHEEAVMLFHEDHENVLKEKIIIKHFSGKTAEFLYGVLFKDAMEENEDNLPEIFSRFKEQYPQSSYIPYVEPAVLAIVENRKRSLNDNMVFVEDGESYQTFEDLRKLVKGKTVLLDMWGTWCGPCRSEISANSEPIKDHFKDSGLEYLYIANHDVGKEKKWKELISFYNLTGMHILASEQLTQDIMRKVNGTGFPTYVIFKKDGTYELSAAGYPMDRDVLIDQIEHALAP